MKKQIENFINKYDNKISIAAIATVPIFFLETYVSLPFDLYIACEVFSWTVWAVLMAELVLKWCVAANLTTRQFIKENAIDLIIITLPLIRTARFVKIIKLAKLIQYIENAALIKDVKKIISLRKLFGA